MSEPHQKSIVSGRIDHHEVMRAFNRADGGGEVGDLGRLVGFHRAGLGALDAVMRRQLELNTCALSPSAAVFDVMGESFLNGSRPFLCHILRSAPIDALQITGTFWAIAGICTYVAPILALCRYDSHRRETQLTARQKIAAVADHPRRNQKK
jgi:hypothetical protein